LTHSSRQIPPLAFSSALRAQVFGRIHHPGGRLISLVPPRPANTLLKQFFQLLTMQCSQANASVKNTAGSEINQAISNTVYRSNGAAADTALGLQIGSGTTAVTVTDWKIETLITTNVAYGAMIFLSESFGTNGWRLNLIRTFTNNTGSAVEIKEVAWNTYISPNYFTVDRTPLVVSLPNTKVFTLTYRLAAGA